MNVVGPRRGAVDDAIDEAMGGAIRRSDVDAYNFSNDESDSIANFNSNSRANSVAGGFTDFRADGFPKFDADSCSICTNGRIAYSSAVRYSKRIDHRASSGPKRRRASRGERAGRHRHDCCWRCDQRAPRVRTWRY